MPKTKIQRLVDELTANYLHELFERYMKCKKITSADMGAILGCTDANIRYLLNKPADKWQISDIKLFSAVLGIPTEDVVQAIELTLKQSIKNAPFNAGTLKGAGTYGTSKNHRPST